MLCWSQEKLAPEQVVLDEGEFDNLEFESEKEELLPGQDYTVENYDGPTIYPSNTNALLEMLANKSVS